jgi:hypothetical protein
MGYSRLAPPSHKFTIPFRSSWFSPAFLYKYRSFTHIYTFFSPFFLTALVIPHTLHYSQKEQKPYTSIVQIASLTKTKKKKIQNLRLCMLHFKCFPCEQNKKQKHISRICASHEYFKRFYLNSCKISDVYIYTKTIRFFPWILTIPGTHPGTTSLARRYDFSSSQDLFCFVFFVF